MSLFEQRFNILLEFEDYQQQKNKPAGSPWHRKTMKGGGAVNQHQVADRYKGRYTGDKEFTYSGELNSKIELLRKRASDIQVLSDVDITHILKNYPIEEIPRDKPKKLSNSGMIVYWDPIKDSYILKRDE